VNCDCHVSQPIVCSSKNDVATFLLRLLHRLSDIQTLSGFFTARLFQARRRNVKSILFLVSAAVSASTGKRSFSHLYGGCE
jgi:hypothetical protein